MKKIAVQRTAREGQAVQEGFFLLGKQFRQLKGLEGVTPERLGVLSAISRREPVSLCALADEAGVRAATMSRMVSALNDDGLVRRLTNKKDGRGILISLSQKGRRVLTRANEKSLRSLQEALHNLSADEVDTLIAFGKALISLQHR